MAQYTLTLKQNKERRCTTRYPSAHKPLSKKYTTTILCCLTFQTLSTQLPSDSANRNLIFHVFGGQIFLPPSYQEGETQQSSDGCKAGTEEQVPTISPVCSITRTLPAILHFSSNCSQIYSTFRRERETPDLDVS